MFRRLRKFAMSRTGQRLIVWAAPIVVGWLTRRLSGSQSGKTTKKTK